MTDAAAAHSALAGVMAGVVLVLLTLVTARKDLLRETFVVRLLVLAFFLLVLAAVVWGVLTGQPSTRELQDAGIPDTRILAQAGRNYATGCAGVVLLAGGALAVIVGVFEVVVPKTSRQDVDTFMRRSTVLLSAFAAFEVYYFLCMSIVQFGYSVPVGWVSFGAMLALICIAYLPHEGLLRLRLPGSTAKPDAERLIGWVTNSVAVSAAASVLAFVVLPARQPLEPPTAPDRWDALTIGVLCISAAAFVAYLVALTWFASDSSKRPDKVAVDPAPPDEG